MTNRIAFVGFGRMGSALAEGAVKAGALRKSQVIAIDLNSKQRAQILRAGFSNGKSLASVIKKADFIFLCVKPQDMRDVLAEISDRAAPGSFRRKCFVSIAAGVRIERIEAALGPKVSVIRVMPNTPALLGAGMSGVSKGRGATASQVKTVVSILSSVGEVLQVPERLMDAVTAVSGSGPAYAFYLAESVIAGAKRLGLSTSQARQLVHQTIYGAGLMLKKKSESAEALRRQVTSPGGTTEAALKQFMKRGFKQIIGSGLQKAAARSKQL